jgi:hypothetical protein
VLLASRVEQDVIFLAGHQAVGSCEQGFDLAGDRRLGRRLRVLEALSICRR